jgi:hypothetical protein
MAVKEPTSAPSTALSALGIDKKWLQEKFAEMDARTGFVVDPNVTIEQLHTMMLADGIRPEDNAFSREILHDRYPDDYPDHAEKEVI